MHSILSSVFLRRAVRPASAARAARAARHASSSTTSSTSPPIVELREYKLHPAFAADYIKATVAAASVRHEHVPTRLFSLPETGGALNVATHLYDYVGGHAEREAARGGMPGDARWVEYLGEVRPFVAEQRSTIFVEASDIVDNFSLHGMSGAGPQPYKPNPGDTSPSYEGICDTSPIYEIRRYQLKLGYDTVPRFLAHYASGLGSKLGAEGTHESTSLVTLLYSDIGPLNEVIEVWRHGAGTHAMQVSRGAARGAGPWRDAISEIADLAMSFTSTVHKPVGGGLSKWN